MSLKKRKRRIGVLLDMTPMVDIAILLLIFYMTTTQFKPPQTREVTLPLSHSQIELPDKDVINITVTDMDSIFVDAVIEVDKELESGAVVKAKERVYETTSQEDVGNTINRFRAGQIGKDPGSHGTVLARALIVIRADRDASYGIIQKVMDSMVEANLSRFQIVTDAEKD
jgi:biopolymer transport protein ExbD